MTKKIFITGATSGVGLLIAKKCIEAGHTVYATGRNAATLQTLQTLGAIPIEADLRDVASFERVSAQLPPLDIVVFSAGVATFKQANVLHPSEIDAMLDVNVRAPMHFVRHITAKMQPGSQFIFIGSQAGKVPTPKASVYAATKFAIVGYVNGLRMELAKEGITVSAIHPGPIDTPFIDHADTTGNYKQSLGRFLLKPEVVADEVMTLMCTRKREVNLPRMMGISSKLYAIAPALFERIAKPLFDKK
ncbi:SDR family NAD(P)-dependent oxidoreductase [Caryophanon tenue]|uniref:Oxidoreductase n=1 Tax=Caryophanon tenue TaxID=33978 RepID=A0A1C0Y739_9BACL|nr:SDR family NAD(P)-dependent oxidoreductase [Caryophanon tenue]OCS82997.1 oxidoreductase [Caryophanon tenue]